MTTGAERGEIADVGSPVLLPGRPEHITEPRRWATSTIAVATMFLAIANAVAIDEWFGELPPGRYTEVLRAPIALWSAETAAWRADTLRSLIRSRWTSAKAARFGQERPGELGASDTP